MEDFQYLSVKALQNRSIPSHRRISWQYTRLITLQGNKKICKQRRCTVQRHNCKFNEPAYSKRDINDFALQTKTTIAGFIPRSLMLPGSELRGQTVIEHAPESEQAELYRTCKKHLNNDKSMCLHLLSPKTQNLG